MTDHEVTAMAARATTQRPDMFSSNGWKPGVTQEHVDRFIEEVLPDVDFPHVHDSASADSDIIAGLDMLDLATARVLYVSGVLTRARLAARPLLLAPEDADWLADAVRDLFETRDVIAAAACVESHRAASSDTPPLIPVPVRHPAANKTLRPSRSGKGFGGSFRARR